MKKLFVVLCDVMAVATAIAAVSLVVWIFVAAFGHPAGAAKNVCVTAVIVAVVATVSSFFVWKNGGAPGGDDPPTEEGDE